MSIQDTPQELWGGETTKAVANFPVSGERVPVSVVRWLGRIKGAAARANAFTDLFLTKLDVLTGWKKIPVCVGYKVNAVRHDTMPLTQSEFHHAVPIYEELDGWTEDISGCREFDDLPKNTQAYVNRVEELCGARVSGIGVGPSREQSIVINDLL